MLNKSKFCARSKKLVAKLVKSEDNTGAIQILN